MIRRLILSAVFLSVLATAALAQVHVDGHFRRDGTYVPPHYRSAPDSNPYNNWSTRGNVNPYTGQYGTRDPYPSLPSLPYPTVQPPRVPLSPYDAGYLVPRR